MSNPTRVTATAAKNRFGHVLRQVGAGHIVEVTVHGQIEAVILSAANYQALLASSGPDELDLLASDFEALYGEMQSTAQRAGTDALFNASADELGTAAVDAARGA